MLTTFPNLGYSHWHCNLHPSQREEGSGHTATIELSPWQKVTNQVVLFVDCPHCHRVYSEYVTVDVIVLLYVLYNTVFLSNSLIGAA